jgi:hypothetical protein
LDEEMVDPLGVEFSKLGKGYKDMISSVFTSVPSFIASIQKIPTIRLRFCLRDTGKIESSR